mgnify:CR=1 FL=1
MNLSVVFAKMAMLVLIMLLGYLCARIGITGPEFNQRVTPLVMNVLLTATILNSVLSVPDFTGRDIVDYVLVMTAATVLQIAVAWFLPRLLRTRSEDVGAARLVTAFGNVGFVGLPVVAAIFGDEMVFFASLANIPFNLALYSIGAAQLSGTAGARFDWRKVLNMPVIATLLSVVLLLSRIHVPTVIADTISTLAGATIPLSMLIIGTPRKERPAIAHPVVNLVHEERYCRADAATMDAQVAEMDAMFRPHAREVGERVVDIYTRKHTSPFMAEMSRSMEWWFKNWLGK